MLMFSNQKPMLKRAGFPRLQTFQLSIVLPLLICLSLSASFHAAKAQSTNVETWVGTTANFSRQTMDYASYVAPDPYITYYTAGPFQVTLQVLVGSLLKPAAFTGTFAET